MADPSEFLPSRLLAWSTPGCSPSMAPSSRLPWTSPSAKQGQARRERPCPGHWPSQGLVGWPLLVALLAQPEVRATPEERRPPWLPR